MPSGPMCRFNLLILTTRYTDDLRIGGSRHLLKKARVELCFRHKPMITVITIDNDDININSDGFIVYKSFSSQFKQQFKMLAEAEHRHQMCHKFVSMTE